MYRGFPMSTFYRRVSIESIVRWVCKSTYTRCLPISQKTQVSNLVTRTPKFIQIWSNFPYFSSAIPGVCGHPPHVWPTGRYCHDGFITADSLRDVLKKIFRSWLEHVVLNMESGNRMGDDTWITWVSCRNATLVF